MDLSKNYCIKYHSDFKTILLAIIKEVEEGTLIQFYKNDKIGYFKDDICSLKDSQLYPDIVTCFFYNNKNKKKNKFSVELYHGFGGTWEEIEE